LGPAESRRPPDELSHIAQLRLRSAREATGLYYVEGLRSVFCALDAEVPIEMLVHCETLAPTVAQKRVRVAHRSGTRVVRATPEQFRSISMAKRASGVGAVLRQHWSPLTDLDADFGLCWIAVGLVRSPGNLGTVLWRRSCESAQTCSLKVLSP